MRQLSNPTQEEPDALGENVCYTPSFPPNDKPACLDAGNANRF